MLSLKNIGKQFNNRWLFKNINLTISNSEVLAVKGHNGAGKSTLLQIISNSMEASEGDVLLNDNEVTPLSYSMCSPHTALYKDLSVKEHFQLIAQLGGIKLKQKDFREYCLLDKKDFSKKIVQEFSSGMKQRVKLAFALLSPAPLLILDEPSSNLDDNATKWFLDNWAQVKDNKINILATNRPETECPFEHTVLEITKYKV